MFDFAYHFLLKLEFASKSWFLSKAKIYYFHITCDSSPIAGRSIISNNTIIKSKPSFSFLKLAIDYKFFTII